MSESGLHITRKPPNVIEDVTKWKKSFSDALENHQIMQSCKIKAEIALSLVCGLFFLVFCALGLTGVVIVTGTGMEKSTGTALHVLHPTATSSAPQ